MRRFVSIVFIALCWLGPLSPLVPGSDESQLPACCRRHGAHRCMMAQAGETAATDGHVASAPAHCPQYHRGLPASAGAFALPAEPRVAQPLGSEPAMAAVRTATLQPGRASADRGPPSLL